jgi:hypothetical protein
MNQAIAPSELKDEQKIDILMKEYGSVRDDIQQTINRAKAHIRHFQIVLTAIIALFAVVIRKDTDIATSIAFWIFVMYSITTIVSYVVFDMVEIQYGIQIGGARCGVLEEMVNKRANEALLVWETEMADRLFDPFSPIPGVLHPSFFLTTYQIIVIGMAMFSVPAYFIYAFWDHAPLLARYLVWINIAYSIISFVVFSWSLSTVLIFVRKGTRVWLINSIKQVNKDKFSKDLSPVVELPPTPDHSD